MSKMFRRGLLILTSPLPRLTQQSSELLKRASKLVTDVLYVHVAPGLPPKSTHLPLLKSTKNVVLAFYTNSASQCGTLDVRILLGNISKFTGELTPQNLSQGYDVVISDALEKDSQALIDYSKTYFPNSDTCELQHLVLDDVNKKADDNDGEVKTFSHTCVGGTFDRLHTGHKIFLSEALMLADKCITIGVTDGEMNVSKSLKELIAPAHERISSLRTLLQDLKPSLQYNIEPITDPFGPSIVDPSIECLVVSEETYRGGLKVNEKRKEKGLPEVDIHKIELVEDTCRAPEEETKISSSSMRKRCLGTFIRDVDYSSKAHIGPLPYVIGLTGGTASGKSSVCKRLEKLGAGIIDCDKLGHRAYLKGTEAFNQIVETFGAECVGEDGEIDRKVLGPKVFASKDMLQKLNEVVWPSINRLAMEEMEKFREQDKRVVVLDAAVLLEANWDKDCHEVWTCIIPEKEAISRLAARNNLPEEQARKRIESQMSNQARVDRANVVLCTLWDYEVTQKQVEKAWELLQRRLPCILRRPPPEELVL